MSHRKMKPLFSSLLWCPPLPLPQRGRKKKKKKREPDKRSRRENTPEEKGKKGRREMGKYCHAPSPPTTPTFPWKTSKENMYSSNSLSFLLSLSLSIHQMIFYPTHPLLSGVEFFLPTRMWVSRTKKGPKRLLKQMSDRFHPSVSPGKNILLYLSDVHSCGKRI